MSDDDDERETIVQNDLHTPSILSINHIHNLISPIQTPNTTNTTRMTTQSAACQMISDRQSKDKQRERENDKSMMSPQFRQTESHTTTTDLLSISSLFVLVIATVNIIGTCCCCLRLSSVSHASMRPIALCPGLFPSPGWPHTAEQEQTNCLDGPST